MTKYERDLLNRFHELYQTEVDGFIWDDCCDYDCNDVPTYFMFIKYTDDGDYYRIDGNYNDNEYGVFYGSSLKPIKTYTTLRRAMARINRMVR